MDTLQISFRVPSVWVKRANAIAAVIARSGAEGSTSSVYRAALERGFEALEAEHGIKVRGKR